MHTVGVLFSETFILYVCVHMCAHTCVHTGYDMKCGLQLKQTLKPTVIGSMKPAKKIMLQVDDYRTLLEY